MNREPRARLIARAAASPVAAGLVDALTGSDPSPSRRWRSSEERQAAVAGLALATLVLCVLSVASAHPVGGLRLHGPTGIRPSEVLRAAVAVAAVAPFPLAARYPLLAWRIGWLALLLVPQVPATWWGGWPWGPPQVVALLAPLCVAGLRHRRATLWWMFALTLIPWWLWLDADVANHNGPISATILIAAGVVAVDSIALRLRAQRALVVKTRQAEAERAQRAVLEERARIARELHDVVAHHMSLIAVQAETAPYRLTDLPESVRAEFGSLSAAAREALSDMRRLLGVLRHDEPAGLSPQPQLSDLPLLVDAARRAGVAVELSVPAALEPVPAGVGVCAYRIVQESLSNASQHAPGSAVTVSLGQDSGSVQLRVANGPGGTAHPGEPDRAPGQGLTGMRERVALLGGSLSAGRAPDGGFVVSAVLPFGKTA